MGAFPQVPADPPAGGVQLRPPQPRLPRRLREGSYSKNKNTRGKRRKRKCPKIRKSARNTKKHHASKCDAVQKSAIFYLRFGGRTVRAESLPRRPRERCRAAPGQHTQSLLWGVVGFGMKVFLWRVGTAGWKGSGSRLSWTSGDQTHSFRVVKQLLIA